MGLRHERSTTNRNKHANRSGSCDRTWNCNLGIYFFLLLAKNTSEESECYGEKQRSSERKGHTAKPTKNKSYVSGKIVSIPKLSILWGYEIWEWTETELLRFLSQSIQQRKKRTFQVTKMFFWIWIPVETDIITVNFSLERRFCVLSYCVNLTRHCVFDSKSFKTTLLLSFIETQKYLKIFSIREDFLVLFKSDLTFNNIIINRWYYQHCNKSSA